MSSGSFRDIETLEAARWQATENLCATSKLTSSDHFMPVVKVIFLRHATKHFEAAHRQIGADQATDQMPTGNVLSADYIASHAPLPAPQARYDRIMQQAALDHPR